MFNGKKISLIFPSYNEEKNIARAIKDFKKLNLIDEIIVVDNNSSDQTSKIASLNKAKVFLEEKQGYGYALRKGMKEASGDYIVLCEPDGTFIAKDITNLLEKIGGFDMVMGTRTDRKFISKRANMGGMLRLGNIFLAKIIQFLYSPRTRLTDCGCTFRVINKKMVKKILPKLHVGGSYFLAELLTVSLSMGFSVFENPVRYRKRVGESKITGSLSKSIIVGLQMFRLIIIKKVL